MPSKLIIGSEETDLIDLEVCFKCKQSIFGLTSGCCENCGHWYHLGCADVTRRDIQKIIKEDKWTCSDTCLDENIVVPGSHEKSNKSNEFSMKKMCHVNNDDEHRLTNVERRINELSDKFIELDKSSKNIEYLLCQIEQDQYRNCIVIAGRFLKDVEPIDKVKKLLNTIGAGQLFTEVVSVSVLGDTGRKQSVIEVVGNNQQTRYQSILVKFKTNHAKTRVMERKKVFGQVLLSTPGNKTRKRYVTIRDYLSNYNMKLYNEVKKFKFSMGLAYCWIQNGRILLRESQKSKVILIKNVSMLDEIRQKHEKSRRKSIISCQ